GCRRGKRWPNGTRSMIERKRKRRASGSRGQHVWRPPHHRQRHSPATRPSRAENRHPDYPASFERSGRYTTTRPRGTKSITDDPTWSIRGSRNCSVARCYETQTRAPAGLNDNGWCGGLSVRRRTLREHGAELAGGEIFQDAKASVEFGGRQAALAVERAQKIRDRTVALARVAFETAGNQVAVGIASQAHAWHDVVEA